MPGTPGSTGLLGDRAPDVGAFKKPTKKELKRQDQARQTEAQLHAQANMAANMAVGGKGSSVMFGGKKKTYSWMNAGKPAATSLGPSGRSQTSTQAPGTPVGGSTGVSNSTSIRRWGDWKETGEKGAGIHMRDLVLVLEKEGKFARNLQRAYSKLDEEGKD